MNRDGHTQSIWQHSTPEYVAKNAWKKDTVYDVLIVGGGITGVTTAYLLQEQGFQCLLIDAHNIGYGTTGGTTAHLNTILDTPYNQIIEAFGLDNARTVANATREAIDLVNRLSSNLPIACDFRFETGYISAANDAEAKQLEHILDATRRVGVVASLTSEQPLPTPARLTARIEFQAAFHPTRYLVALIRAFEEHQGVVLENCLLTGLQRGDIQTAETTLGQIRARHVVYATHIPPGINLLHFRCAPYRSYVQAFTLRGQAYPKGLIYDLNDPYNYYRTQVINGTSYVIAGGFDHKTGHEPNTAHVFAKQEACYRKIFNIDTIAWRWSSQYYNNTDGLPYIGLLPGHERVYTATGFSGNGITWGVFSALLISQLIARNHHPYADLFSPSRVKPVAGFTVFVKENADVASQYISQRLKIETLSQIADLAPGDAVVAHWEGQKLGLFKNEDGVLYGVDPVCAHAQCIVAWNAAEQSWDCPCHGARFAVNGALLTGPARKGLTPVIWDDPHSGE